MKNLLLWLAVLTGLASPAAALEIDPNDFRISHMGPDQDLAFGGGQAAVAYNSVNDEFFIVWVGNDDVDTVTNGAGQVFGQRLDAQTGELLGPRHRLSDIGDDDSTNPTSSGFNDPIRVAYNSQDNQYLVVWAGSDVGRVTDVTPLAVGEREVFGQRVDATTGEETGDNDFRISVTGIDGDGGPAGLRPSVAYNSVNNEYLVVWMGFDVAFAPDNKQGELFGRLINAGDGSFLGTQTVLRVPDPANEVMGNFLEPDRTAVAYNPVDNEYFAVFRCDCFGEAVSNVGPGVEIFGQRLDAAAAGIGVEKRLSDMGTGNTAPNLIGDLPRIAFNAAAGEYLVVWMGDDVTDNETEIFGQRVSAAGDEIGTDDIRISFMGQDGDTSFGVINSDVAYNSRNDEFLVVWEGEDDEGGLVDSDVEIFGQRVGGAFDAPGGDLIGDNIRLSDMWGIGTAAFAAQSPAVAYNPSNNISLVVWSGYDDVSPLVEFEIEVFGQLVTDPECGNGFVDPGETCDDGNADDTDSCLTTCVAASCGDGFVQAGVEGCDDGNVTDGDGCSAACAVETPGATTGGTTTGGETTGGDTGGTPSDGGSSGCSLNAEATFPSSRR